MEHRDLQFCRIVAPERSSEDYSSSSVKLAPGPGSDHMFACVVMPIPVLPMFKFFAWNSREVTYLRTLTAQLFQNRLATIINALSVVSIPGCIAVAKLLPDSPRLCGYKILDIVDHVS